MRRFAWTVLPFLLAVGGCDRLDRDAPIAVSVIGRAPGEVGPAGAFDAPDAVLASATGLGLVRLDQDGQPIAGLAIRWALYEDGRDAIFRIDEQVKPGTRRIARGLRRALGPDARALLLPGLAAPIEAEAVTDGVVELRLPDARPDLLALLAASELTVLAPDAGPYRIAGRGPGRLTLAPRQAKASDAPAPILLRGERAGRAVARFAAGEADLVLGGTFENLAVAQAAALPAHALIFDPTTGLFGFAVRARSGPLTDPAVREALSLALDRDRILTLLGAPLSLRATTVGGSTIEPPSTVRLARAQSLLGARALPQLRIVLPEGPGATLLFRLLQADWARIGISVRRVAAGGDLELVDRVLPAGERARFACATAPSCDARNPLALLVPPFVPIAAPIRWSLVGPGLARFTPNALAAHPLDRLR